jgi:TfoX/Sxy family transcriptional regulator of competence genes
MGYDPGLVARVADALEQIGERGVRQKNVFGGRGFLRDSHAFAIAWGEGLLVKLTADEVSAALTEPGVLPFAPNGEQRSRSWVNVTADAVADDPDLAEWLRRALRAREQPAAERREPRDKR